MANNLLLKEKIDVEDLSRICFSNHFDLFNLPHCFEIDIAQLERSFHAIQQRVHPDRFVCSSDAEMRIAIECASKVNEAYRVLKSPLERGIYILALRGIDIRSNKEISIEQNFLVKQMELQEKIEDALINRNVHAMNALLEDLQEATRIRLLKMVELLNSSSDDLSAKVLLELLFIARIKERLNEHIFHLK